MNAQRGARRFQQRHDGLQLSDAAFVPQIMRVRHGHKQRSPSLVIAGIHIGAARRQRLDHARISPENHGFVQRRASGRVLHAEISAAAAESHQRLLVARLDGLVKLLGDGHRVRNCRRPRRRRDKKQKPGQPKQASLGWPGVHEAKLFKRGAPVPARRPFGKNGKMYSSIGRRAER